MGRKKNKRKVKRNWKHGGLQGIPSGFDKKRALNAVKDGGILVLTTIGGGLLGAAIGKHSLFVGIPVAMAGKYFDNDYIVAAGLGMSVSNGFQNATKPLNGTEQVDGLDMKQMAQDAKDRVGKFFDNFKEKLYMSPADSTDSKAPASDGSTNGLAGNENVQYFINPMSTKDLDLSAMERVEQQVAALNRGTNGLEDIDREF
jgi:hypothetical protein